MTYSFVANEVFRDRLTLASGTLDYSSLSAFLEKTYGINTIAMPRYNQFRLTSHVVEVSSTVEAGGLNEVAEEIGRIVAGEGELYGDFVGSPILIRCQTMIQARSLAAALQEEGFIEEDQLTQVLDAIYQHQAGEEGVELTIAAARERGKVTITTFIDRGVNIISETNKLVVVGVGVFDAATNLQLGSRGPRGTTQEGLYVQIIPSGIRDLQKAMSDSFNNIVAATQNSLSMDPILGSFYTSIDDIKESIVDDTDSFIDSLGLTWSSDVPDVDEFREGVKAAFIQALGLEVRRFFSETYILMDIMTASERSERVDAEIESIRDNLREFILYDRLGIIQER